MSLGSYIIYLRAHKDGITPREVAAELELPEHYIHAIELEKHAGDAMSRGKLAEYFETNVDDFSDYARSTHSRFMEVLKRERRPQMGFTLMNGDTLLGTVDGADSSIIKIVELNTGVKTILQRHAIKKWWPLKPKTGDRDRGGSGGGGRPPRPGGDRGGPPRPGGGYNRPPQGGDRGGPPRRGPGGGTPPGNSRPGPGSGPPRPGGGNGGGYNRPPQGGPPRPNNGGNNRSPGQ